MASARSGCIVSACALALLSAAAPAHAKFAPGHVPRDHLWFSYGVRYTHPQRAAVSLTLARAMETDTAFTAGWFAQVEPGLGGGKVSAGLVAFDSTRSPWTPFAFGAAIKGTALRTWGTPHDSPPGQTLLGPEVDLTVLYFKLSAGYLWRAGGAPGPAGRFTWGVGAGF